MALGQKFFLHLLGSSQRRGTRSLSRRQSWSGGSWLVPGIQRLVYIRGSVCFPSGTGVQGVVRALRGRPLAAGAPQSVVCSRGCVAWLPSSFVAALGAPTRVGLAGTIRPWVSFQAGSPCSLTIASSTPAVCTGHWVGLWDLEFDQTE